MRQQVRAPFVALVALLGLAIGLVGCTTTAQPPAPSPSPSAERSAPLVSPSPTTTPTPTPTPSPTDPLGDGPVTALLFGTDSRESGDMTGRADAIMLAHLPASRDAIYLVSFTRDTWVDIPGLGPDKLNHAFSRGGTESLAAGVSNLLGGIEIDYTVQANFEGFIALTRALEGFTVDNKHHSTVTVNSTGRVVDFPEGQIELSGTDGLIYVRERKRLPMGDLDRTERQRAAVIGMLAKAATFKDDPVKLAEVMGHLVANTKVTPPLDLATAIELTPLAERLGRDDIVGVMAPIASFGTENGSWTNYPDEAQTAALGQAIRDDDMAGYVATYGTDYNLTGG